MNKKDKKISVEDMNKEPEKKGSKVPLIIGIVLCVILIPMLIVNCALIISGFANPDKPPSLFGYTPMIVLSPSMSPLIEEGDIVIAKSVDAASIEVGDVISFFDPASTENAILTHRVIDIYEEEDVRYAVTAGDFNANNAYEDARSDARNSKDNPDAKLAEVEDKAEIIVDENASNYKYVIYGDHRDSKPVELSDKNIVGTYTYTRIPFVGKISMFMQSTWGWVICIAIPLLAFLAYELISRKKNDKSKEKDMDALLAELEALKAAKAAAEGANVPNVSADNAEEASNDSSDDTPKEE